MINQTRKELEHSIRYQRRYIETFRAAAVEVIKSGSNPPARGSAVDQAIHDSFNGCRRIYKNLDGEFSDEMHREGKRLLDRYLLLFSNETGPRFKRLDDAYGGAYQRGRKAAVRQYYPELVEKAKPLFFERAAKLIEKAMALNEERLKTLTRD